MARYAASLNLFSALPCCLFVSLLSVGEVTLWEASQHIVDRTSWGRSSSDCPPHSSTHVLRVHPLKLRTSWLGKPGPSISSYLHLLEPSCSYENTNYSVAQARKLQVTAFSLRTSSPRVLFLGSCPSSLALPGLGLSWVSSNSRIPVKAPFNFSSLCYQIS